MSTKLQELLALPHAENDDVGGVRRGS